MNTKLKINELAQVTTKISAVTKKLQDLEEGQFQAVLSTSDIDRHGEIVSISGIIIPKDQTIKMYYNHQTYGENMPIGKWIRVWKQNGVLMGIGEIDMEDEFAVKIYKKILKGYIDSISIGFYPQEFDGETITWTKSTLVEASVVAEPANVAAKITQKELKELESIERSIKLSLKKKGVDIEKLRVTFTSNTDSDANKSPDDIEAAVKDLTNRVKSVEDAHKQSIDEPSKRNIISFRLTAKQADKAVEVLNKAIKFKLSEK